MIWYTYKANSNVTQDQFVQLSSDGLSVELHTNGTPVGVCISVEVTEDTQERICKVYVAGGSGQDAILYADWNGSPTRFEVVNGKVNPVTSGGIGWILPEYPRASKSSNQTVKIAVY
tara:strand:+ start:146 stop:496 length:351 start_codon:yes stop_codon:yes gene_type:complete